MTDTFRSETRAWLAANCPPAMRQPVRSERDTTWGGRNPVFAHPDQKLWMDRMGARGWTVPDWPAAYGGGGLSAAQTKTLREEMAAIGARNPLSSFGISMLGPALLKYGTEAQKLEHLPKIARGEIRWCQGYSEPDAGSDLAGLRTSAEDAGDHFVVNGQKLWTSHADHADWIFCLVRTDRSVKQGGISFLLFDMASPGVSTRPIRLISGNSPFCETFFDDVRVPKANLVGELHRGWDVAKYLLGHEREMISAMGVGSGAMARTVDYLKQRRQFGVPIGSFQALQHRAAHLYADMEIARAAVLKAQQLLDAGSDAADSAVSVARAMTTMATTLSVQEAVQMHGGIGMTDDVDIGFFMKRARVLAEMFGDAGYHADRIATLGGY